MSFGERFALIVLCLAGAVAGAVGVLALKPYARLDPPPAVTAKIAGALSDQPSNMAPPAADFAGIRFDDIPLEDLLAHDEALLTDNAEDGADDWSAEMSAGDAWSAETRAEAMKPNVVPRAIPPAAERLPWKNPAPARTYKLSERLAAIAPAASTRLAERFAAAKAPWPPAEIGLVALKDDKVLELFARAPGGAWSFIHRYPVLAASGKTGPKLVKGDRQVPEGVYAISFLNPNSRYHVSLRVNYPNGFDREMAASDGRSSLGGDIMIHGKNVSEGCLAIGDAAAEELFVLAAKVGLPRIKLIIAPTDFRGGGVPQASPGQPPWVPRLYTEIAAAMSEFPAPPSSMGLLSFFGN